MYNFDPYNVLLSIATNIPVLLMTAFVLQGHICHTVLCEAVSDSSRTWSVVQDSELRFFLRQHTEHHVPGRFPAAVQNPGRERPERTQRADVHHDTRQTRAPRDHTQNSSRQTESGAHVQRQVRVHLIHIREISTEP